ncbi:hypothetical protein ACHWQZ_G016620 [Mnemiopsis leidyi]
MMTNKFNHSGVLGKWKYSLLLLLANIIYIYIGTQIFIYIEAGPYAVEAALHLETKEHLMEHLKGGEKVLPQLLNLQKKMCRKNNDVEKSWHFTGALTYCLSILSTVGYGVMRPHDALSRGVSMLYGLIGLPIYAVYLNYASMALARFLYSLTHLVLWCCKRKGKMKERATRTVEQESRCNGTNRSGTVHPHHSEAKVFNNGNAYRRLSSEVDTQQISDHDEPKRPVLVTENTVETLLSSGSGDSIKTLPDVKVLPSVELTIGGDDKIAPKPDSTASITYLSLNLCLSFVIFFCFIVLLLIWCPLLPEETFVDEIYWLIIRFTTIGFGDEFRDITRSPSHLPGYLNALIVSLVVLPLGISLASHIFYVYRKIGAERLRRVKCACLGQSAKKRRGIRIKFECECITDE